MTHSPAIIINHIKELKKEILPSGKLILFGSQARQDTKPESDWDLLMLIDKDKITLSDFDVYAYPFVELGWRLGEYFSMKLYTFSEWETSKYPFL